MKNAAKVVLSRPQAKQAPSFKRAGPAYLARVAGLALKFAGPAYLWRAGLAFRSAGPAYLARVAGLAFKFAEPAELGGAAGLQLQHSSKTYQLRAEKRKTQPKMGGGRVVPWGAGTVFWLQVQIDIVISTPCPGGPRGPLATSALLHRHGLQAGSRWWHVRTAGDLTDPL